jgi:hypothetical protein
MTNDIRRNKDGQQNLADLRKALAACQEATVQRVGGNWEMSTKSNERGSVWLTTTLPYHYTERQAIQRALLGEAESKDEVKYWHAARRP